MYNLGFSNTAIKDLDKLEGQTYLRISDKMNIKNIQANIKQNIEIIYKIFLLITFSIVTYNNIITFIYIDINGFWSLDDIPNRLVNFVTSITVASYAILPIINVYLFIHLYNHIRRAKSKEIATIKIVIYILINIIMFIYSLYLGHKID